MNNKKIQMFNAQENPKNISGLLKKSLLPDLISCFPFFQKQGIILFHGSAARGNATEGSDIDVMILLPRKVRDEYINEFYKIRKKYEKNGPIRLSYGITIEPFELEEIWNDEMLLKTIQEAFVIHDPNQLFPVLQKKFAQYPEVIKKEKVISLVFKLFQFQELIQRYLIKGNMIEAIELRLKLFKLIMILLKTKENEYYDGKYLYKDLTRDKKHKYYLQNIDLAFSKLKSSECDKITNKMIDKISKELMQKKLLPRKFIVGWQQWPMKKFKYKINPIML